MFSLFYLRFLAAGGKDDSPRRRLATSSHTRADVPALTAGIKPASPPCPLWTVWFFFPEDKDAVRINYWYGIMRLTLRLSPSLTSAGDPRFRLRFLLFDVRMCRRCDRPRFIFPVPVTLKRLAAPLCVFSFGIEVLKNSRQFSAASFKFQFSQ
jgi:hypothetical protein